MKVAIIIVNYNSLKNTQECLQSLRICDWGEWQHEMIIVDNDSSDGSQVELKKQKDITLITNIENTGFCEANNQAVELAIKNGADALLILNNDTVVSKDFFIYLSKSLKKGDILCPKIYFEKNYEFHKDTYKKADLGRVIWYAGGRIDWRNVLGVHIGVDEVDKGKFDEGKEIEFATGACMLIKREVIEKIGLFDEKYFLYLEDMDFCVRAKRSGFKIYFEPKSTIWHKNAGTTRSGSDLQDYYFTRNRMLFAFKFAKLGTKLAVIREAVRNLTQKTKRKALLDFLTFNFQKGSYKIK